MRFIPYFCIICGLKTTQQDLCGSCKNELPWIKNGCYKCGLPLENQDSKPLCGNCLQHPPPFDKTIALFHYQPPIDKLITGLKFANKLLYAKILGKLMCEKILQNSTKLPQLLIPIPLHKKRLQVRGFNQALEIARITGKKLKIPINKTSTLRIKATQAQAMIPAKQRMQNIKNAFVIAKPLKIQHAAVIDDVITTGNTIREFCHTLQKHGITNIDVWSIARTSTNR